MLRSVVDWFRELERLGEVGERLLDSAAPARYVHLQAFCRPVQTIILFMGLRPPVSLRGPGLGAGWLPIATVVEAGRRPRASARTWIRI